ncbi:MULTISPECIES: LytR/AlgR family response regulator transcription factor [Aliiglaciecola]|uniref:LytR/AlgR family response regulator transcription factor n=1 Tax=Aliiglaciecola TaxID=1406885 RepID=UPI001C099AC7|nr:MULTISPECIES: LytTR family DNA-binding domain-containing protein [Aliiglaciecola]MBU2878662.1 LytTR family DNA-binding domain-containing protein [Aliiglaciecola lipolytica]MDO6709509.1 LytTR family DNA-binding domain-containing protein [Aliiglaciecola sp. 2_MG-2023]MDO6750949.1 LytTR family DNA-binding domain-containing protein [Aliiglaciecola sp. 1_MG-2023]
MLNVLIADDEYLARETIKVLLSNESDIGNIYEAEDGNQALSLVSEFKPDVVFLDIEMPKISGIQVAKHVPPESVIIFATAYNEHAVEAFELNAIDYILKPYDDERFFKALERARAKITGEQQDDYAKLSEAIQQMLYEQQKAYRERLVIRDPGRIRLIDVAQITFISGAGNYAEIHLDDGKHVLHRETLSTLEEQLNPQEFVRIHRSSIVRRSAISELRPNDKGDYSVILQSGEVLTLSRRNRVKLDELTN